MVCGAEEEAGGGENREWSVEEREEKDTVEGEKKSCMKEDISNRPSCLREQRWCGGSCSLFLCSLSVSLILLTKHVVSWMLGLGPKPACWAWEEHRVIDMGDYLLLWSCLTLHPHYLTSQDWDCWQAHTQTQQLYTCFTSGASVCLGLRSSKAYLTHQKPSQIGLISS